jgi:hypothetical protein
MIQVPDAGLVDDIVCANHILYDTGVLDAYRSRHVRQSAAQNLRPSSA